MSLRYCSQQFSGLASPIDMLWDGEAWLIDLHTLCRGLGLGWRNWRTTFQLRRRAWRVEACLDRHGRETLLMPADMLLRWVGEARSTMRLCAAPECSDRAKKLARSWRDEWAIAQVQLEDNRLAGSEP